jgi:hypothetical protein
MLFLYRFTVQSTSACLLDMDHLNTAPYTEIGVVIVVFRRTEDDITLGSL